MNHEFRPYLRLLTLFTKNFPINFPNPRDF